jgi:hypothetical protein
MQNPLRVGDILFDTGTHDIGVLLSRHEADDYDDGSFSSAWKTFWIYDKDQYYSELGLIRLIEFKVFLHYPVK